MAIPLSKDLETIIESNFNSTGNANLLFTKYVNCWGFDWRFESKEKGEYLEKVKGINFDKKNHENFLKRWKYLLDSIGAIQINGKVLWRLVVGLGSGSVLETSMTLHHIYGVPFIPGSALKGVIRAYYIQKNKKIFQKEWDEYVLMDERDDRKYKNLEDFLENNNTDFIKLFGSEGKKGTVTFLDSYPTQFPKFEMDIMNPHFQDYYSEGKAPADWLSPNPIKFITVGKDTEFIFAFITNDSILREKITSLIKEALCDFGIGAKTAVGYGYFKDIKIIDEPSRTIQILPDNSLTQKENMVTNSIQTSSTNTDAKIKQLLPKYLKSETHLIDDLLKPDSTMKSEEEYKKFIESSGKPFKKDSKQLYEKAKKWYEKEKTK